MDVLELDGVQLLIDVVGLERDFGQGQAEGADGDLLHRAGQLVPVRTDRQRRRLGDVEHEHGPSQWMGKLIKYTYNIFLF